jgi:hypothetical protein
MNTDENHKRIQELRRIGFQKLLTGVVILFGAGCICFIFLDAGEETHFHSYVSGRGLGLLLVLPAFGFWNIVRGIIYLIRARSGDEHYAKGVDDALDKYEKKIDERMGRKVGNGSMHNVLVLLVWIFLFLAVVGAIGVGYLFWTRP